METFNPILIGATLALALGSVGLMAQLRQEGRAQFVYAQLCVMVGIYVGFAIIGLDGKDFITRADWSALAGEVVLMQIFMFAGLAVLSSQRIWLLGALILAHGVIDLLHFALDAQVAPAWYAFACLLYDAVVGAAAVQMLSSAGGQKD